MAFDGCKLLRRGPSSGFLWQIGIAFLSGLLQQLEAGLGDPVEQE